MGKITYASLKLKVKDDIKTFDFNGNEIEVKQFLSIQDKIDLVDITLQKAKENNLYNPIKIDMYFHLYLIYLYTNISFTEKQREDEYKLYDVLESNGLVDLVLQYINEEEYLDLIEKIKEKVKMELKYGNTIASVISKVINDLPKNAETMQNIIDNFDQEKYQAVLDFAVAANGGREIK